MIIFDCEWNFLIVECFFSIIYIWTFSNIFSVFPKKKFFFIFLKMSKINDFFDCYVRENYETLKKILGIFIRFRSKYIRQNSNIQTHCVFSEIFLEHIFQRIAGIWSGSHKRHIFHSKIQAHALFHCFSCPDAQCKDATCWCTSHLIDNVSTELRHNLSYYDCLTQSNRWFIGHCANVSTSNSNWTNTKPRIPPPSRHKSRPRPIGVSESSSLMFCSSSVSISLLSSASSCVEVPLSVNETSFLAAAWIFDVNL